MNIVVVWGPPCSGKSTFARERMGENDVVFDYDAMRSAISVNKNHSTEKSPAHKILMALRKEMLYQLQNSETEVETAYVLTCYPHRFLKDQIENAEYIRLEVTEEECLRRLSKDRSRSDKKEWAERIKAWFEKYGASADKGQGQAL